MATNTLIAYFVPSGCNATLERQYMKIETEYTIAVSGSQVTVSLASKMYVHRDSYGPSGGKIAGDCYITIGGTKKNVITSGTALPELSETYVQIGNEVTHTVTYNASESKTVAIEAQFDTTDEDNYKLNNYIIPVSSYSLGAGYVESGSTSLTFPVQTTACTAPASFTASPGPVFENALTFAWSGSGGGVNNAVEQHEIQSRYSTDGSAWSDWIQLWTYTNNGGVTLTVDWITEQGKQIDLSRGNYFQFRIRAIGSAGWGYQSEWKVCDTTFKRNRLPYVVPAGTPEGYSPNSTVRDPATSDILSVFAPGSEVSLNWTYFKDPDGNLQGGKFEIQYKILPDGDWTALTQITNSTGQGHYSNYIHVPNEVGAGETVQYRVRAVDALGAASADWIISNTVQCNSAPSAPTGGQISKNEYSPGNAVIVSWTGIVDSDGNVSVCRVYWAVSESEVPPEQYTLLAEVETEGAGEYGFVPDQAEYQQYLHLYLQAVDSLGAYSETVHVGAIRRNDDPLVTIGGKAYLVTVGKKKYMPVVRKNGVIYRLGRG